MFFETRTQNTPYFTVDDPMIQVGGPPVHYAYGCHVAMVTRGALRDMYRTRKASFKDTLIMGIQQRKL